MTSPDIPLADVLDTVGEVRKALAYVPQLCSELKWAEAREVVDEQLVQLRELLLRVQVDDLTAAAGAIQTATSYARAARVLIDVDHGERLEVSDRAHPARGAVHRANPDIGYADVPLWNADGE